MFNRKPIHLAALLATAVLQACSGEVPPQPDAAPPAPQATVPAAASVGARGGNAANVTAERLTNAESEPGEWMSHGRTYSEQRFSPLDQINTSNVNQLGLAFYADLDTRRGQEATPIMVDGVLYVSTAWSKVKAFSATNGEQLWAYDPEVDGQWAVNACCDVVNRGVAVWEGKVFVGTIDGRLIALDANSGQKLWDVNTIDKTKPYTITGAPRVIKGKVLIGNGGAELGVRGYGDTSTVWSSALQKPRSLTSAAMSATKEAIRLA